MKLFDFIAVKNIDYIYIYRKVTLIFLCETDILFPILNKVR